MIEKNKLECSEYETEQIDNGPRKILCFTGRNRHCININCIIYETERKKNGNELMSKMPVKFVQVKKE